MNAIDFTSVFDVSIGNSTVATGQQRSRYRAEVAMPQKTLTLNSPKHEIRFQSLFHEGRALAFPCDHEGRVNLDGISERARNNYLFARTMVGRDYETPRVYALESH